MFKWLKGFFAKPPERVKNNTYFTEKAPKNAGLIGGDLWVRISDAQIHVFNGKKWEEVANVCNP